MLALFVRAAIAAREFTRAAGGFQGINAATVCNLTVFARILIKCHNICAVGGDGIAFYGRVSVGNRAQYSDPHPCHHIAKRMVQFVAVCLCLHI